MSFSVELFDLYLLLFRYGVNVFYITIHHNDCTLLVLHFSLVTYPASITVNGAKTTCELERTSRYVTFPW